MTPREGLDPLRETALNAMSGLALTSRITGLDSGVLTLRWTRTRDQLLRLFETPA
ncbi:hypothetical protein [Streptomyces sp. NPDC058401]|uniref:hypothetical protein n=1 Tax=Streptomyces sp. NPDC058401 TaxID=3346480 RepID=UPI00364D5BAB